LLDPANQFPVLALTMDASGNLYGTTVSGGAYQNEFGEGDGTVFELSPCVWRITDFASPAGVTASLPCDPRPQRLSGRRSDERGTGRRQVAKPQRFSGG